MRGRRAWGAALLAALVFALSAGPATAAEADCPAPMRCLDVNVPLDRSGTAPGSIDLPVVVDQGDKPVFLLLAGGPGQGLAGQAGEFGGLFRRLLPNHRFAALDQRGTGSIALRCPSLQRLPLTDLMVPPRRAVRDCGNLLGPDRSFYTTTDTVEDIEAVRVALGVEKLTIMGVSYGTYVAERYATAHPDRVERLILDSVVPQRGVDPFFRANFKRAGHVLRKTCARRACETVTGDPVRDLARLVRSRPFAGRVPGKRLRLKVDGPAIFDWLTSVSSFQPRTLPRFQGAVTRTLRGDRGAMLRMGAAARALSPVSPAESLSWALHAATLCSDMTLPFSISSPFEGRRAAVRRAVSRIPARSLYPFDRKTAAGNGALTTCADWPATVVDPPPAPTDLPPVPVLLFAGAFDLSTPLAEARRELARAPEGELVVLPGGHGQSIFTRCGQRSISKFMTGKPAAVPCGSRR